VSGKATDIKTIFTGDFLEQIQKVTNPDKLKNDVEEYLKTHTFDINVKPLETDTILWLNDTIVGTRENVVAVTGKAKSRKTVVASALMTALFLNPGESYFGFRASLKEGETVLHIDSEQGYYHYYNCVKRIFDDAGLDVIPKTFTSVQTRDADVEFSIEIVEYLIEKLKPSVCIIDGITDFIYDINDNKEATKMSKWLLRLSTVHRMLFVVVIHTTKTTGYMTGAVGTMIEKRAESVIKVELDEGDGKTKGDRNVSHISCQYSRNAAFESFSIRFSETLKKYEVVPESQIIKKGKGGKTTPDSFADPVHETILTRAFTYQSVLTDKELLKKLPASIKEITGDAINYMQIRSFINYYNERAWIYANPDNAWMRAEVKTTSNFTSATDQTGLFLFDTDQHNQGTDNLEDADELPF
jgi:KaiC/GvpD/RAD55 family RecA-like ATPase